MCVCVSVLATCVVFEELELLKLWKGLYMCLWMTDKPLVQEDVADELAALLELFTDRQSGKWVWFVCVFQHCQCVSNHIIPVCAHIHTQVLCSSLLLCTYCAWNG